MNQILYTTSLPGRTVALADGREYLWFSGTDYLGMGWNETFRAHLAEGLERYGTHYGSSRNGGLRLAVYEEAEASLAAFVGAPAALAVSSGMWAGQLVMRHLEKLNARFHYAPGVHPALWGPNYAPSPGAWGQWLKKTTLRIEESQTQLPHVLCTDAVGSPWLENRRWELLDELPDDRPIWLVADDSHGLGVLGENGRGAFQQTPRKENVRTVVTASLNKALGVPGGVIFGDSDFLKDLSQSPWFAGSSPSAPAYFYALQRNLATGTYREAREVLLGNLAYFTKKLPADYPLDYLPKYPVFCGQDAALHLSLLENNILTTCFPYPSPTDRAITRLVITPLHQKKDLDRVAEVVFQF